MEQKETKKNHAPGSGRKKLRPEYDAGEILREQMDAAAKLYEEGDSLKAIADELFLNPIKVRKLLITAGVYESEIAEQVADTFGRYRETQEYGEAMRSTMAELGLSRSSVTSYLPYEKGVYFPGTAAAEHISVNAERQRRHRIVKRLRSQPTEENLWEVVLMYRNIRFRTYSGLAFAYDLRRGRNGEYTRELWIDRREKSKSLSWSSILMAMRNIREIGSVVERPKDLGDIRGVSYIYGMFYRFGLIDVPELVKEKMKK